MRRAWLPAGVEVVVGGAGAAGLAKDLGPAGVRVLERLSELGEGALSTVGRLAGS
ncbi:MAG: hypothetical protein ACREN3_01635 [Gemmatimonadaceae bacterium]